MHEEIKNRLSKITIEPMFSHLKQWECVECHDVTTGAIYYDIINNITKEIVCTCDSYDDAMFISCAPWDIKVLLGEE